MLSVIIPAYNEAEIISTTAKHISSVLNSTKIEHELIFVNDGSKDNTWSEIVNLSKENKSIKGVCLSKNFGKDSAIFAGLEHANGECSVVMDCDLQHPAQTIVEMYSLWQQGYEIVEGVKSTRGAESKFYSVCAKFFYKCISTVTKTDMSKASDFKLLDKKVVEKLLEFHEQRSFFRALSAWVGYNTAQVEFDVQKRVGGKSKWSTFKLAKYAISSLTSFTTAPMQIVTILGVAMLLVALVLGVIALVQKFIGVALSGFTTVIMIELFVGSIVMISLGVIGYYIAKIYEQTKDRPRFIVSKTCGSEDE